ncbi:ionotropic receptor 21a [Cimex lectularius]|uniref:Ionotropic receptor n=1 Tax=Cimex lectularius TaxID=79782 RepID=A0A8I6S519_CIMLE|nr:ionotropic receptor 21a [Cimex lectularius]
MSICLILLFFQLYIQIKGADVNADIKGYDLLYEKYELLEAETDKCMATDGTPYITSLFNEICKLYLTNQVPVLLYDNDYSVNLKFQRILNRFLKIYPKSLRHGLINVTKAVPQVPNGILDPGQNEQLAFIIFSKEIEIGALAIVDKVEIVTKTIFIPKSSLYQIKEFLTRDIARKFHNILVLVDPTLKIDIYFQKKGQVHKECDINMYTHQLASDSLGGSKAIILTSWRRNNFTRNVNLFPDKFKTGFNGMHMVVSTSENAPFVFKSKGHDSGEGYTLNKWDGLEVRIMNLISQMLNFSVEYKEPDSDPKYANLSWTENSLRQLALKQVDYAIGGIYLTAERYKLFTFTHPYSQDCASFISLASTALPKYRAIMGPFLWDVWLALTTVYLLAIFPIAFSVWHTVKPLIEDISELENMFWYVFGTFTNCFTFTGQNSWTHASKTATRIFIGSYWAFTIIITACYTGSIIAFITLPVFPEVIDSSKQLVEEEYKISTLEKDIWLELLTGSVDPVAHELYKELDFVPNLIEGLRNVTRNIHSEHKSAFFGSKYLLEYTVRTNYTPEDSNKRLLFHLNKECFVPLFLGIALPKKSMQVEKINLALSRLLQSGFMFKVSREVEWAVSKMSTAKLLKASMSSFRIAPEDRELTLDDTQGMFLLLGAGFAIAIAALMAEILVWCVKEFKQTKFGQPSLKERSLAKIKQNLGEIKRCLFDPIDQLKRSFYESRERNVSSLFGSGVSIPEHQNEALWIINLKPPQEKPIRLRSF